MALTIIQSDYDYTDSSSNTSDYAEDVTTEQNGDDLLIKENDLLPTLVHCYLIIFLGYLSGKLRIITKHQIRGLLSFINMFALPAFIFGGLVNMKLDNVNWRILVCVVTAKAIVFTVVVIITLNLTRPVNIGMAGLYGIFVTQSNDYALGFPLLLSSHFKHRSVYLTYLYLLEPLQLITFNPVGFFMMDPGETDRNVRKRLLRVCSYIIRNSIIVTVLLGIAGNALFHRQLPAFVDSVLEILGISYPAIALFILGRLFANKYNILTEGSLVVPGLLITAKNLLLPSLIWKLIQKLLAEDEELEIEDVCSFGFLYGTFPTSPSVLLFDTYLGLATDAVAIGIVGSTLLSAVLTFLVNSMTFVSASQDVTAFNLYLLNTLGSVSVISALCCLWVLSVLIAEKQWMFVMRRIQFLVVISQLVTSCGGMLQAFVTAQQHWVSVLQSLLSTGGLFSIRIWSSLLAMLLALLQWKGVSLVLRAYRYVMLIGIISIASAIINFIVQMRPYDSYEDNEDRIFQFVEEQLYVVFAVIVLTLFISVGALLVYQHYYIKTSNSRCTDVHKVETQYLEDTKLEVSKCVILLLLICFSTAVSFTSCLWKIFMEGVAGIYSELTVLDAALNYGQGVFSFFLLGLDDRLVIEPFLHLLERIFAKRYETTNTSSSPVAKRIREEFASHATKCKQDICTDQRIGDRQYKCCFRGKQLVDWLMSAGLTNDRAVSEIYGQQLLSGGVIRHASGNRGFRDDLFLYTFTRSE